MARKTQTRGACAFCGREMTRGGLARHLETCPQCQEAIEAANQGRGREQPLYHLVARDAWGGDYWLHLEMNGSATLDDLDRYLRAIWLECCGHLSQFSIGGWRGDEIPMGRQIQRVFTPGLELTHIYDFGTESQTLIQAVSVRTGKPLSEHPIYLMARNNPPEAACQVCGQPAAWLCIDCWDETDQPAFLCDEHAEDHEEGLMAFVNSPRVGMCGYNGPAKPPY